ncbi:hypothetical protein DLH98_03505 [Vibrio parahaemolyticus]|nr:hypothetical protein [Vibrio parahaemolyticus]MCU8413774.1 hypothetical protein [Vibrio vulnificus]EGQ9074774.1 hypothetical protein [Vibrio parahaemolyticus]EGQ9132126.1 hypothetical protein [Vibrio parahaemolyticus]EGQ9288719.1 hypothetical protein [Vibrio parahaemolyticus]
MILLITDITNAASGTPSIDIVNFKVIDGEPTLNEVTLLLNQELEHIFTPSYSTEEKEGRFLTLSNECIQGMHFNSEEHNELHH